MQTTPWRCNIVKILAVVAQAAPLGLFQTNLEILAYPFRRIMTLLSSCGKFVLAQLATKGKSLKEVAVLQHLLQKDLTRPIRDVKKNGENCIRVNGGCAILQLLLDHFF